MGKYKNKIGEIIKECILIDTKLLIRHLKELHVLKKYFFKLNREDCYSYDSWLNFLNKNKISYKSSISSEWLYNKEMILKNNISLLSNNKLFKPWVLEPIVLGDFDFIPKLLFNNNHEIQGWYYISDTFLELKKLYIELSHVK